jgi:hypothetical protein
MGLSTSAARAEEVMMEYVKLKKNNAKITFLRRAAEHPTSLTVRGLAKIALHESGDFVI